MDDADVGDLVRAAAAGDRAAWDELVSRFSSLVWAVARGHRLQSDDAAEVFQTTWLRLVEHLAHLRQPERVGAWLVTTARRECLQVYRLHGRETVTEPETLDLNEDGQQPLDAGVLRAERDDALWHCLETSPTRCRTLLRMLLSDPPPSYAEVSAVLDMPIGSIGPTRRRCLEHIRRRLVEAGVGVDEE